MKFLNALLLLLLGYQVIAHEGHQAFYKLQVENGALVLEAKLEMPDLKKALKHSETCTEDQDFNFCAGIWLMDCVSVVIDGKNFSLTLESSIVEKDHLLLTYSLGEAPEDFEQIDIKNTAFTEAFNHYENIFEIELNNQKKGYKLTEKRTSISHLKTTK